MYRYRDNRGSTFHSRKAMTHLTKLGTIQKVRGYRYHGRYHTSHEGVMVHGENGTARFNGFCWGYSGEGPRGLIDLLIHLGLPRYAAQMVAFETERLCPKLGNDWVIEIDDFGGSIVLDPDQENPFRISFQRTPSKGEISSLRQAA